LLTLAVIIGEFTFANVLLFDTFAVIMNQIGQHEATEAAALSVMAFLLTWAAMAGVLIVGRGRAQVGGAR
jgi:putative spermidine/putrescine transport system permease protein